MEAYYSNIRINIYTWIQYPASGCYGRGARAVHWRQSSAACPARGWGDFRFRVQNKGFNCEERI